MLDSRKVHYLWSQGGGFLQLLQRCFSISQREVLSGRRVLARLVLKLDSELCVTWSSPSEVFLLWEDNVPLHQPFFIQLVISWAGRITTFLLLHPFSHKCATLLTARCASSHRLDSFSLTMIGGKRNFICSRFTSIYSSTQSTKVDGCSAHSCCLCLPPASVEGAAWGHKSGFLQLQGCLTCKVRELIFTPTQLSNQRFNFSFSLSQRQNPGINTLLLCEAGV